MGSLHKLIKLLFIGLILISLQTCDSLNTVCTDELIVINVRVLSMDEEPIDLDQVTVTGLETGGVLDVCDGSWLDCENGAPSALAKEGIYPIFHDGLRDEIPGDDMKILVEGSNSEISFQEKFEIGDDGCHVFKEAGPDTVFVEVE